MREMLSRMDSYELAEWKVLYSMEPWGEIRDDYRSALQTAHSINFQRDRKKNPQPAPIKDFLLTFTEQEEEQPVIVSAKTQGFANELQARLFAARNNRALKGAA